MYTFLWILVSIAALVSGFTGDDKFLRKYAMMKVYESCFGQEVVKEVRMEMKAAASKCAGIPPPGQKPSVRPGGATFHKNQIDGLRDHSHASLTNSIVGHLHEKIPEPAGLHSAPVEHQTSTKQTFDLNKLQEAIMAGYNKPAQPVYHPQPHHQYYQPQYPGSRPYYQQPMAPAPYYPQPYQQYSQSPAYYSQPQPYPQYQPAYYPGRSSRDLDVRGQLETLTNRMSGRIRNVTCVMQELGYLDQNLEPDYTRMIERIGRLPVSQDLKKDMAEGVDFCRQFSQCVPDDKKDKLIREMVRPMFFFRCYKHKKLEACIMKDVRERYSHADDLTEDNLSTNDNRSAKEFPEESMATAIYEFLYGENNIDVDTLL